MAKTPSGKPAGKSGGAFTALRLAIWGAALAVGLATAWLLLIKGPPERSPTEDIGLGSYRLTTTEGKPFTEETLRGEPSLVFFGFTHCPDVCPTTLGDIAEWQELADVEIRTFFVTVDPERDTPEILADYVGWLPGAVGATGPPEAVAQTIKDFKIYAARVALEGGDYTMNHSAYVMLFGADGRYRRIFSYQTDPARAAAALRAELGKPPRDPAG